jgi:hypothetical protein
MAASAALTGCGITQSEGEATDAAKTLSVFVDLPYASFTLSTDYEEDFDVDWPTE